RDVADDVEPTAVQEHMRDQWENGLEGPCAAGEVVREPGPVEGVAVEERFERAGRPLQAHDVEPDGDVHEQEQARDRGGSLRRIRVGERDHRLRSVAAIFEPWAVYTVCRP